MDTDYVNKFNDTKRVVFVTGMWYDDTNSFLENYK